MPRPADFHLPGRRKNYSFWLDMPRHILCPTLKEMNTPSFNLKNKTMEAHPSVHFDDHVDGLRGHHIIVMISPRVQFVVEWTEIII